MTKMTPKSMTAIAVARPMRKNLKAVSYMYMTRVLVELTGPPWVRMKGRSKTWSDESVMTTTTKSSVGRSRGSVIDQKSRQVAGAVELGGFVEIVGNCLKPGEEDDHVVADAVPDRDADQAGHSLAQAVEKRLLG